MSISWLDDDVNFFLRFGGDAESRLDQRVLRSGQFEAESVEKNNVQLLFNLTSSFIILWYDH